MLPYARLTPGPGFRPDRAAFYYAQRLVTQPRLRRAVSRGLAAAVRLRHGTHPGADEDDPAHRQAVAALRDRGLSVLGDDFASPDVIERITAFFRDKKVVGPGDRLIPPEGLPPGSAAAAYPLETVLRCPDVLDLINAPSILRIAADYLGCKPTLSSLGVRWSFPSPGRLAATQRFHRDTDDWRSLKLFIYLTDVDANSGPHVYVLGSHETAARLRARPYDRAELGRDYGDVNIRTIVGPSGTAFVADIYGIHMGLPPALKPRLILQAQYSVLPIFAFLYQPVALPVRPAVDGYVNRLMIAT